MKNSYFVLETNEERFKYMLGTSLSSKKYFALERAVDIYRKDGEFKIELVQKHKPGQVQYELIRGPPFLGWMFMGQDTDDFFTMYFVAGGNNKDGLVSLLDDFIKVCDLKYVEPPKELQKELKRNLARKPSNLDAAKKAIMFAKSVRLWEPSKKGD